MLHLSLRKKLFLVSLLIFLVPWIGIRYIQAIEDYLQQSLLDNLSHYTQSVSIGLSKDSELIPIYPSGDALFAIPLQKQPLVDGYDSEWEDYIDFRRSLLSPSFLVEGTKAPTLLIGKYENSLYLNLQIADKNIIYLGQNRNIDSNNFESETIQLILESNDQRRNLIIQTEAPGTINARDHNSGKWFSRIQGVWKERDTGSGYQIELKIPYEYVTQGFNIKVFNVGEKGNVQSQLSAQPSIPILSSPKQLTQKFDELVQVPGRRIYLLDRDGRMLVKSGKLITEHYLEPINPLFAWLLIPQKIDDPWKGKTRLQRSDIQTALMGSSDSRRIVGADGESVLLSSAWPIIKDNAVVAVLLIEESTAAIQLMQRSALSELLNLSLLVFILISIALIGFAGRLANRIRKLRDLTDHAIDQHGRVTGLIPEVKQGDELTDLTNHVSEMLQRLQQYHEYLENLASRLSHELRTPVAVVQSSLQNMQLSESFSTHDQEQQQLLARAEQGITRLQAIINRMSEASRLEHSISDSVLEEFDLTQFMQGMVQGYNSIYTEQRFVLKLDGGSTDKSIVASKDLLAQLMDKLMNNAASFATANTDIQISVKLLTTAKELLMLGKYFPKLKHKSNEQKSNTEFWIITIANQGPSLPDSMEHELFQSMVSIREKASQTQEPHLGLGLHIVRLITDFHQGEVSANNLSDGVCFNILLPKASLIRERPDEYR